MQPLVSIIIPTYNRAHLIGETLDSVLAQTYTNWECIVVDDGSKDHTAQLMASYCSNDKRFQYHHRPKDRLPGGNAARNYGFENSKGEYIQWFDSDDIMLPEKLALKVQALKKVDVDFVVCDYKEIYCLSPYLTKNKWSIKKPGDALLNHLKSDIAFTTAGPMFKRSFLIDNLLFNETIRIGQEWEFYTRLLVHRPNITYLHTALYHFRNLDDGIRKKYHTKNVQSRSEIELSLYRFIAKHNYFKNSSYLEDYNTYIFFQVLRRYRYLRAHTSWWSSISYLWRGLQCVPFSFYIKALGKKLNL